LIQEVFNLEDGKVHKIKYQKPSRDAHVGHCVRYSSFLNKSEVKDFSLLSSNPRIDIQVPPLKSDIKYFYSINRDCVVQGDPPPKEKLPCTKPKLIGTSDLDDDGLKEYWFTEPYTWDTGFSVSEDNRRHSGLESIIQNCDFCSD